VEGGKTPTKTTQSGGGVFSEEESLENTKINTRKKLNKTKKSKRKDKRETTNLNYDKNLH